MSNIQLVNRCNRAIEKGDRYALESCLAEQFHYNDQNTEEPLNRQQFIDFCLNLHKGLPDLKLHVADLRAGNPVHGVRQITGTHTAALDLRPFRHAPIQATDEEIRMPLEDVTWTIRDGKIVAYEVEATRGGGPIRLLEQLGVVVAH